MCLGTDRKGIHLEEDGVRFVERIFLKRREGKGPLFPEHLGRLRALTSFEAGLGGQAFKWQRLIIQSVPRGYER